MFYSSLFQEGQNAFCLALHSKSKQLASGIKSILLYILVQYVPHRSNPHFILTSFLAGKSCADLYKKGATKDGIYTINPDRQGEFKVRCDMTTSGGGWTLFQRRIDGSVDFYLGWNNYTEGFGNLIRSVDCH